MKIRERDLHDPELSASIRTALGGDPVPDDWLDSVHAIPSSTAVPRNAPRRGPMLRLIGPQFVGGMATVAATVGFTLKGDVRGLIGPLSTLESILRTFIAAVPDISVGPVTSGVPAIAGLILFVAFVHEASRGFDGVRRWLA